MRRTEITGCVFACLVGVMTSSACQKATKTAPETTPQTTQRPAAAPALSARSNDAGTAGAAATPSARVDVLVTDEGFVPGRIPAKAGQEITLVITRKVERTCATEIIFQGQEAKTDLPFNKAVEVKYTPKVTGEIKFGCAMGMMIGGVLAVSD
jgi:hypothetical protein